MTDNFLKSYRALLRRLKREGDIVDYKVWQDSDGNIHARITPLPVLRKVTIDPVKYRAAIDALVKDLNEALS